MRCGFPDEADQRRLAGERALGRSREEHDVAALPPGRHPPNVGHEADATHDRRRRDRGAVGVVVERDIARDDGDPERLRGERDPFDCLRELLHAIAGFSGLPKLRQSVRPIRLATRARDVARCSERRPGRRRGDPSGLAGRRPLPARPRAPDSTDAGAARRRRGRGGERCARADEMVVLLDHLAHVELGARDSRT